MKKFICCLLPLFALQLNSCAPKEYLSWEVFVEARLKDRITITDFKSRTTYKDGMLNGITNNTYDENNLLVTTSDIQMNDHMIYIDSKKVTEHTYNEDGLPTLEKETTYDIFGEAQNIKSTTFEYDTHKNITKQELCIKRPDKDDDIHSQQMDYVYDKNEKITKCTTESYDQGMLSNKKIDNYSYDEHKRLIKEEIKGWSSDFDDPEAYNDYVLHTFVYEDNKIIGTSKSIMNKGTIKTECIDEFDSKNNLIYEFYRTYDQAKPLQATTSESFYEYNNKGLETNYRSYTVNGTITTISTFEYRTTTYCGENNDKIESQMTIKSQVHKFNDSNSDKTQCKCVRNYYDNNGNVIKQEITEEAKSAPTQTTYLFEY